MRICFSTTFHLSSLQFSSWNKVPRLGNLISNMNLNSESLHRDSSCLWPDIGQCRIPPEFYWHVGSPVYQNKRHNIKYLNPSHIILVFINESKIYKRKIFRISKITATVYQKWLIMAIKVQILNIYNTFSCLNKQMEFQLNIIITHQGYNIVG